MDLNTNIDHDKQQKVDQLLRALEELPDEMIAQANPDLQRKPEKKDHGKGTVFFIPRILVAAAMLFLGIGICYLAQAKIPQHKTAQDSKVTIPEITVVAYAARPHTVVATSGKTKKETNKTTTSEDTVDTPTPTATPTSSIPSIESKLAGYDAVALNEAKVTISEYSLAMSSTPAMPFSFQLATNSKSVHIEVKSDDQGVIQKWDTSDEDGTWHLLSESKKAKCKPDEVIYWSPKNQTAETAHLTVNIYNEDMLADQKTIEITCNDQMTYQAQLLP